MQRDSGGIHLRKNRFSDEQIAFALEQKESGVTTDNVCKMLGISERTFYRWKTIYAGMKPSEIDHVKRLEIENSKLRKLVADLSIEKTILQDLLDQKWSDIWAGKRQESRM
jgi:putative transposase